MSFGSRHAFASNRNDGLLGRLNADENLISSAGDQALKCLIGAE